MGIYFYVVKTTFPITQATKKPGILADGPAFQLADNAAGLKSITAV
jgi:hypothetical protein